MSILDDDGPEDDTVLAYTAYLDWKRALREIPLPSDVTLDELATIGRVSTRGLMRALKEAYPGKKSEAFIRGIKEGLVPQEN